MEFVSTPTCCVKFLSILFYNNYLKYHAYDIDMPPMYIPLETIHPTIEAMNHESIAIVQ
jgi:hypothetical protein